MLTASVLNVNFEKLTEANQCNATFPYTMITFNRPCSISGVYNNNNSNNQICKAPECQKTSVALADRNSRGN